MGTSCLGIYVRAPDSWKIPHEKMGVDPYLDDQLT